MRFNIPCVLFKITTIDRPWYPGKPCISVWSLVCSSEVGVPFYYAHMPVKTDIRQRYGETGVVHTYQHDENTEAHSQTCTLSTLRLRTYSHSHYTEEQNKETYMILFTLCNKHKTKPNKHMTMPNLHTKP